MIGISPEDAIKDFMISLVLAGQAGSELMCGILHIESPAVPTGTLVHFLCDPSHFGAHVTYKEESDGGDAHYHLSYPERHVPAVLLGNSAEGQPCHESSHCNKKKACVFISKGQNLKHDNDFTAAHR